MFHYTGLGSEMRFKETRVKGGWCSHATAVQSDNFALTAFIFENLDDYLNFAKTTDMYADFL